MSSRIAYPSNLGNIRRRVHLFVINNVTKKQIKELDAYFKHPRNQHESLENITMAINAITDDGIKLVNIGNY